MIIGVIVEILRHFKIAQNSEIQGVTKFTITKKCMQTKWGKQILEKIVFIKSIKMGKKCLYEFQFWNNPPHTKNHLPENFKNNLFSNSIKTGKDLV